MKIKWREIVIVVVALLLISLVISGFSAWDATKPADNQAWNTAMRDVRYNWDALEVEFGVGLAEVHPYYQAAAPTKKPDGSTSFDSDDLGRIWIDSDDNTIYVLTATSPTWTSITFSLDNDTYFTAIDNAGTGSVNLIKATTGNIPEILVGAVLSADTAPAVDAGIANKKYVDAHGMVQVVNTQTGTAITAGTVIPYDNTIPQNTEGVQVMTLAITPTNANNKLKIEVIANVSHDTNERAIIVALFQDSTANALAAVAEFRVGGREIGVVSFTYYMTAGTTSSITFKVRVGGSTNTAHFNSNQGASILGGTFSSSITITEIKV